MLIYKILLPSEWVDFRDAGRFDGSPLDRESGFIHFSAREQVAETARRVFAGIPRLVILAVDASAFGESLRWEDADRGRFPHVYGNLPMSAVVAVYDVPGADAVDRELPPIQV